VTVNLYARFYNKNEIILEPGAAVECLIFVVEG